MNKSIEYSVEFFMKAIKVTQPIGEFLIASIPAKTLCEITYFDVRRMVQEREIETYLGIQRPLKKSRVAELEAYVNTVDACFPTAVILAVDRRCAEFDEDNNILTLHNYINPEEGDSEIYYRNIAKVLDGQHRIAGLQRYEGDDFEVNVSIFIDIDLEDQSYIFSTVNLAQTKVSRSLAYDLFGLAKTSSPQKTCHNIAVSLDKLEQSPFFKKIKRLGTATKGRKNETLTQQQVVESLLPFITDNPSLDRDVLKRGTKLSMAREDVLTRHPFRNLFVSGHDLKIAEILLNYFNAVKEKWPIAWHSTDRGMMLNKTNGFRALMRILRLICSQNLGKYDIDFYERYFRNINIKDDLFHSDNFLPGTSGESSLFKLLIDEMKVNNIKI